MSWGPSRGDIFGLYKGTLFHKFYTGFDWQPAGVETLAGPAPVPVSGTPTALSWGGNRLDAFYTGRGVDGYHVFHRYWDGDSWEPPYEDGNLGEDLGGPVKGKIAATSAGEGHIDLVAQSPAGDYVTRYLDGDSWKPDTWISLGGSFAGAPATVRVGDQLHVFGIDAANSTLLHKYWAGSEWVGWEDLGGTLKGRISASSWGPGRFDVFAICANSGTLKHIYFQTDHYSDWEDLGAKNMLLDAPAVVSPREGVFSLVAPTKGAQKGITYISKGYDGNKWVPDVAAWDEFASTTFSGTPAVVSWSNTTVAFFGVSYPDYKLVWRYYWGADWYPFDNTWADLADLKAAPAAAQQAFGVPGGMHAQELR